MIRQRVFFGVVLVLALTLALVYGCTGPASQERQLKTTALQIQKAAQSQLNNLDRDISAVASDLSRIGLSGPEARQILNGLSSKYPFIIDCCTADPAGKIVTVAPNAYSHYEGSDISGQSVAITFNETKKPALSQMFRAVEGMDAVVIMWPVLSDKGDFIGSVSALFKPETLFARIVEPAVKGTDIDVDVIQVDGLVIYASIGTETGTNLLTDPTYQPYKELVELGAKMTTQESGSGNYTFIDHTTGKPAKKQAFWVSVGLHGTAWRLVSVEKVAE